MQNPLFSTFLDLSTHFLSTLLQKGDIAIDATMGAGNDTLFLAKKVIEKNKGQVFSLDIQEEALSRTQKLLEKNISPEELQHIFLFKQCHSSFPKEIQKESVKAILYNLGYLPQGDKSIISSKETTLKSIENALSLLHPQGAIFIHAYSGHPGGKEEKEALLHFLQNLSKKNFSISHFEFVNRKHAPSLFILQKVFS